MAKQHDKQFKLAAFQYYQDHKDLGVRGCAENLGTDRLAGALFIYEPSIRQQRLSAVLPSSGGRFFAFR